MKQVFSFVVLLSFFVVNSFSQKVNKEKVDISFEHQALVKLEKEPETFRSNSVHLKMRGLEYRQQNPDLTLINKTYPAVKHSNWWLEDRSVYGSHIYFDRTLYSQPYTITIMDTANHILFHRVYNIFEPETGEPVGGVIKSELSAQVELSRDLSYMFSSKYEPSFDLAIFNIEKSTEHDDINRGVADFMSGLTLHNKKEYEQATVLFEQALEKWMAAFEERNLSDKKARINEKVAKGLYQNLIQVLAILEKYEEAEKMLKMAEEEIGGFFMVAVGTRKYVVDNLKVITKGKNAVDGFSVFELEYDHSVKPMVKGDAPMHPESISELGSLVTGSWRYMYVSADELPTSIEGFNPENRLENGLDSEEDALIHFNPDGSFYSQNGSWEQEGDHFMTSRDMEYWKLIYSPDGKEYLARASEKEDFDDISENFQMMDFFEVFSVNNKKLVLKVPNYNPDRAGAYLFIQFQRVQPFSDMQ